MVDESYKELPTEDEIYRPGSLDNEHQIERYIYKYLKKEYKHTASSFTCEFDCRKIYISNIKWK